MVGLGPGSLDLTPAANLKILLDPSWRVVLRTREHPAAAEVAERRPVETCDDLYREGETFEGVYAGIARRVIEAAAAGPVVYGVPGSPRVGESAVRTIRRLAAEEGIPLEVLDAPSFLDLLADEVGLDPLADGLRLVNAHALPNPLVVDLPMVIAQVDTPEILADVAAALDRALPEETRVTVLKDLGTAEAAVRAFSPAEIPPELAGPRTSLYVPPTPGGWFGAVWVMRRLRAECPWDRRQTHHSLVEHLVEETFELVEAVSRLPEQGEPDWVAYAELEEELGDVLLQVLFHTVIASEVGAFDVDDVGERLRRKLVRRHPHVFGDVEVADAAEVKRNWDRIKAEERGVSGSVLDGIPRGLPALSRAIEVQRRAAKVGFDWPDAAGVIAKIREEVGELEEALPDPDRLRHELGDLFFSVVNLARRLDVEPELVLRAAVERFERRFRAMEEMGSLQGLSLEELDRRWEHVKAEEVRD